FSKAAKVQWQDADLLAWRSETTRKQWTPDFRERRRAALEQTFYRKTMAALKQFKTESGLVDVAGYAAHRLAMKDKSLLRIDKFCKRYFDGDVSRMQEAVALYNHRIVSVERVAEPIAVYDLEVPGTHNFALASGVFVHNSAKQGRDRHFQAILPLRGKILNVERARLDRMLASESIKDIITALGTGIGEGIAYDKLRYGRIILMSDADVDGSHIRTLLLTFFFRHMNELINRGRIFIAQPPLYQIKKGKSEKYIKDEKEYTREIMRRATENLSLEIHSNGEAAKMSIEGGELRAFLLSLDEYEQMFQKVERRLRDTRVVAVLGNAQLRVDHKADFQDKANMDAIVAALTAAQVAAELQPDEEHSAWSAVFHDSTNSERHIGIALAAQPEYKRFRSLARQIGKYNEPPFVAVRGERRDTQADWASLLVYVKNEGKRDVSVQRYKGLGEMNADQLAETTMNREKRTLLQVRLEDAVASEEIFTTLMGEDVESRRKFIEDNALDVKNLDV
ncbi:MAG TPA: toprim domain-containing protein, partial [Bryobacteraceae bacterium]|nr:toprim domain-containing protein [Bryobacteraceae bacterium]